MHGYELDANASYDLTPVDEAKEWLDRVLRLPLRFLIAALLCPIVISFLGEIEFIFPWDSLSDGSYGFVLVPLFGIGLVIASRFPGDVKVRAILCALAGLVAVAIFSMQTRWVFGALLLGLVGVVAGNRVSKHFSLSAVPRAVAAAGGALVLLLCLLPVDGASVVGALFAADTWSGGGWMFCLAIAGVLVCAVCAVGLAVRSIDAEPLQRTISLAARATMAWMPACLLFGRLSIGPELGLFDGGGITTFTVGFKIFATAYATLICAAVGAAAWLSAWLWEQVEVPAAGDPGAPSPVPQELTKV